jgi:hypothetical protein
MWCPCSGPFYVSGGAPPVKRIRGPGKVRNPATDQNLSIESPSSTREAKGTSSVSVNQCTSFATIAEVLVPWIKSAAPSIRPGSSAHA